MLKAIKKLLVAVGKPFYWALELVLISFLASFSLIWGLTQKIRLPKIPKRRHKIRIVWPREKRPLLSFLKLRPVTIKLKPKVVFLFFLFLAFFLSVYLTIFQGLPSPATLTTRPQEISTKIYDRHGILLYKIYKDENRTLLKLNEIPLSVRLATLAAEDAEFYVHPGFSIRGIFRSLVNNLKSGEISGGSTVTQQLVKNALLTPEKTLRRKLKEIVLAVATEHYYPKDQILEMYLNEVSYGGTAYGVAEAANQYFAKEVNQLTLAEAAYLAGLIKSPTKFSPYGPNPELALEREKEVLHLMVINKFITPEEERTALAKTVTVKAKVTDIKAPHFVMYVRGLLVDQYGEEMVAKGGLEVTTSLDLETQKMAEAVVKTEVEKLQNLKVGNGAALVLNPQTGEILAMVGSKDYFDSQSGNVNVILRPRQPGSSIKVVNYAYALSHGFTPATIIDDSPVSFGVAGQPVYAPVNYDGQYRGKITLRSALAQSRNIPAVKVLASYGVEKMIQEGQSLGITTWNEPNRFGLSLTLGGGEVKLIDLATVYATLANSGRRPEINPILEVKNSRGETLTKSTCREENRSGCPTTPILDPRVAFLLTDILKDNLARAPEFGLHSFLVIPRHPEVAVKTGTSNNLRDNLTVGYNQNYLVAVWVGNNDNSPMSRVASGVTGASPIWNKIMSSLLADEPSSPWPIPAGLVKNTFCQGSTEWFLNENVPKVICPPTPSPTPESQSQILEGIRTQN